MREWNTKHWIKISQILFSTYSSFRPFWLKLLRDKIVSCHIWVKLQNIGFIPWVESRWDYQKSISSVWYLLKRVIYICICKWNLSCNSAYGCQLHSVKRVSAFSFSQAIGSNDCKKSCAYMYMIYDNEQVFKEANDITVQSKISPEDVTLTWTEPTAFTGFTPVYLVYIRHNDALVGEG